MAVLGGLCICGNLWAHIACVEVVRKNTCISDCMVAFA